MESKTPHGHEKRAPLVNILDVPILKSKAAVSLSSFTFLFAEYVQHCQAQVSGKGDEIELM